MDKWPLQDAKARFSLLVNTTLESGAQIVTRHGDPVVVVLPFKEYKRLLNKNRSLAQFLLAAPRIDLNINRSKDLDRVVEL